MGLSYGYGAGTHHRRSGGPYRIRDADAAAAAAAMDLTPPTYVARALDKLVIGLKADGLWSPIKLLALHAIHHEHAGRVNIKDPSIVASLVGATSPGFLVNNGFMASAADHRLAWPVSLATLGASQNSCCLLVWSLTDIAVNDAWDIGTANSNPSVRVNGRTGLHNFDVFANADLSNAFGPTAGDAAQNSLGLYGFSRGAAGNFDFLRNGQVLRNQARASTGLPAGTLNSLRGFGTVASNRRIAISLAATHIAAAGQLALYNRLLAYMEAVHGTPVPL